MVVVFGHEPPPPGDSPPHVMTRSPWPGPGDSDIQAHRHTESLFEAPGETGHWSLWTRAATEPEARALWDAVRRALVSGALLAPPFRPPWATSTRG